MVPPQFISGVYLAPAVNYTCRLPDNQTHHTVVAEDSCSYIITNSSDDGPGVEELCTEWDFDTSVFSSTLTSEGAAAKLISSQTTSGIIRSRDATYTRLLPDHIRDLTLTE
ncbi:hypothetical protein Pmani_023974 [Petrolisthes manimaculis]|uniref:Uncharacterized protein n=1 Tax=Petrolisthes manimaculis TaxID=1843537 RepID=A0AAE1PB55_9EUCA|nr:hypothetical protein Pmani_023974 [Petrolisthes manimaculis]